MFAALIAFISVMIALALTSGWTVFWWTAGRIHYVYRSEDPIFFWLAVFGWATTLGVALWTVIRLIRARLL